MSTRVVETRRGKIAGLVEGDLTVFRGIPYAKPPFGDRLWRLPEPPESWEDVLDCTSFGPICPQPIMQTGALGGEPEPQGEDCLRLNVWTPMSDEFSRTGPKLPVMVWIHGGAYLFGSGSGPGNRGDTFARDGIVFVSMNYRLGAMGFLDAGAIFSDRTAGTGNYGIADQVAALEWVRDNIEEFGGDPSNVTVFGVSAGANYTQSLTVCPPARGLFKRVISESAGGITLSGLPRYVTGSVAGAYLEKLGVADEAVLSALKPNQLLDAQAALLKSIRAGELENALGDLTIPFYPIIGTDYQPWSVIEADARGEASGVDLILGTNLHEMTLFKLLGELTGGSSMSPRGMSPRHWEVPVRKVYVDTEPGASDERIDATVEGDRMFRIPNIRAAEARVTGGGRTWVYEFAWESPVFDGRLGAAHGLEIPFVFDDLTSSMGQFLLGGVGPAELAKVMHGVWIAFARDGNPVTADFPEWPEYDLDRRYVAVFDAVSRVESDPGADRRRAWEGTDIGHDLPLEPN